MTPRPEQSAELAKRGHKFILGAGLMFLLAGGIPVAVDLIRGAEVSGYYATIAAIGAVLIAVAYMKYRRSGGAS